MKKIYLVLFVLLSFGKISSATIVPVQVENFVFNPAVLTVNAGDTIMWMWSAGFHTTTSVSVPAGAMGWDAPVDQSNPMYMQQLTVEGEYDYQCSIHAGMGMVAHITVLGTSGLPGISESQAMIVNHLVQNNLEMKFNSGKNWQIEMRSLTGALVKQFSVASEAGKTEVFPVEELPNGIYIVRLTDGQAVRSQRVVKQ